MLISKAGRIIIIALLGVLLIGKATNGYSVARANSSLQHEPNQVELQAGENSTTYLPVVLNNSFSSSIPQNFGVEIDWNDLDLIKKADEANA